MSDVADTFDPWGPVSAVLYEINDSDFVQNAIANTGIDIEWRPFTRADAYSHSTRIRALRRDISASYVGLGQNKKGLFTQIIVKSMLRRRDGEELRAKLLDRLGDIGWTISEEGVLTTEDALVSEQFFPANSEFDAYVAIRDVLGKARADIVIVDAYIGRSLLMTLRALPLGNVSVRILTAEKNLRADFHTELATFRKQLSHLAVEVRTTADFHDRFIAIDGSEYYHVGASIKDAGKRAFMISRLRDQKNINSIMETLDHAWAAAKVLD